VRHKASKESLRAIIPTCRHQKSKPLEEMERASLEANTRFQSHLFLPFVAAIMSNESILEHVRAILGPDLLVWFTEWHTKPPYSNKRYTPHQDSTYAGLEPGNRQAKVEVEK